KRASHTGRPFWLPAGYHRPATSVSVMAAVRTTAMMVAPMPFAMVAAVVSMSMVAAEVVIAREAKSKPGTVAVSVAAIPWIVGVTAVAWCIGIASVIADI